MSIIIIQREEDIKRVSISEKDFVIALNPRAAGNLEKRGVRCFVPDYNQASSKSVDWMKSWPDKNLNGESFKEIFGYNGLSIWWLMENWLFYSPIWPLKPVLETIAAIKPILDKTNGDIVFVDDGSPVSEAIKLAAGERAKAPFRNKRGIKAKAYTMRIFFDASYLLRKISWGILSRIYKPKSGSAKILLFSVYDWEILRKGGKVVRQDTYIAPLIKYLNKEYVKIIGIPVGRFLGLRNIKDKLLSGLKFNVLEQYDYRNAEFSKARKAIESRWKQLKSDKKFKELFNFQGINIWKAVKPQFDAYFTARLKSHLRDYFLLKSLLEKERPSVVLYPAEMSEFGRELFHLCKKAGVKTLAIQHGVFGNWLNVYHTKKELSGRSACPMPTKTAVYGHAFRDTLVKKCNYPKNSVVVTGAQRFDRIAEKGTNIGKELGIPENKNILTLITSPVPRGENEALTKAVFLAVKSFSDTQMVVKIHPNESDSVYHDMKRQLASDAIIVRDIDLYDVIRSSAATMTYLSTAGMESILLGKPLIVVNLSGRADVVPYVKEKVAIGVYREEDLKPAIEKALAGSPPRNAKVFIEKYAYKNDGKASERVCKVIRRLINL